MRIAWRTVGAIVARVSADAESPARTGWPGLRRIGIDELSYKKGHRYITCAPGRSRHRPAGLGGAGPG